MGRGFNALLGISRIAAKSAKKSLNKQERQERLWAREEAKRQKELAKRRALKANIQKVKKFENDISNLCNLHKIINVSIDWKELYNQSLIPEPQLQNTHEMEANERLKLYKPNVFDKVFNRIEIKIERLKKTIEDARLEEKKLFDESVRSYMIIKENNELAKMVI